jgi:CheY-like chemotaxis protein
VVSHKPPAIDQMIAGVRVLVTDDEPDARDVMRVVLESHGAEVVLAGSAAEAMEALQQSVFDAIVADIGMPDQDGYSMMRSIRLLPADRGGAIPAIAVTAYATLRERDDAINAGFTAHMGKPFDPDRLVATISKITQRAVSS